MREWLVMTLTKGSVKTNYYSTMSKCSCLLPHSSLTYLKNGTSWDKMIIWFSEMNSSAEECWDRCFTSVSCRVGWHWPQGSELRMTGHELLFSYLWFPALYVLVHTSDPDPSTGGWTVSSMQAVVFLMLTVLCNTIDTGRNVVATFNMGGGWKLMDKWCCLLLWVGDSGRPWDSHFCCS